MENISNDHLYKRIYACIFKIMVKRQRKKSNINKSKYKYNISTKIYK